MKEKQIPSLRCGMTNKKAKAKCGGFFAALRMTIVDGWSELDAAF
jgi:hypothetical protein